jgi:ARG/rhodanese/phosphatase superfamily protein
MTTLTQTHSLGEPQVAGPLAVFPVFGPPAALEYRAFVQAVELGALVKELESAASVGRLLVDNPTDLPLLLYEGEEVLGAQQNRLFDRPVLVPAGGRLEVSVSCVEQGRWDNRRHGEPMHPSPQAADPSLRRRKRHAIDRQGHSDQGEVWAHVAGRLAGHGVASPSAAMSDVYDGRRGDLAGLSRAVHHVDGQIGALACVASVPVALDLVSRSDVFAALLGPLAQGYALDALGAREAVARTAPAAEFLHSALAAARRERPSVGMGRAFGLDEPALVGAGLEHDDELVQLSAFPAQDGGRSFRRAASVRIARPSRRRA